MVDIFIANRENHSPRRVDESIKSHTKAERFGMKLSKAWPTKSVEDAPSVSSESFISDPIETNIQVEPEHEIMAINAKGVRKSFGDVIALDSVDLNLEFGKVLALLGPNGAGKTTLIKILTTLISSDRGKVEVGGYDVFREPNRVREIIGLAGQNVAIDDDLTGEENIGLIGSLYHLDSSKIFARTKILVERFDLIDSAARPVKTYSGGMRRRLDLAASLIGKPKILFLDEPSIGLDPKSRLDLWAIIKKLVKEGTTILLTTQYLEEADHLADEIIVIDKGKVVAKGTPDFLKSQVGGEVLEVHISNPIQVRIASQIISKISGQNSNLDSSVGLVTVSIQKAVALLPQIIREFDNAKIELKDVSVRRPTLNEVFLTLTGHLAEAETTNSSDQVSEQ